MKKKICYELSMTVLAVLSVIFAVANMRTTMPHWMHILDTVIYGIFLIDYILRLIISKKKSDFIKSNIPDLIAIIPFNSLFRIFRIAKLARLTRLSKFLRFSRLTAYFIRLYEKIQRFMDTNGFKYILLITMTAIGIGGYAIHIAEEMSLSDGLWWAFVTATTVGYGDISPSSGIGRIIAMCLMPVGIGLIGSLTSTITSFFLHVPKQRSTKMETIEIIKNKLDHIEELQNEEVDEICRILEAFKK